MRKATMRLLNFHWPPIYSLLAVLFAAPAVLAQSAGEQDSGDHTGKPLGEYLGAKLTTHPDWFKQSFLEFEEDIAEAAAEGKRLILYFHQDGCPYCNLLVEHNFTDSVLGDKVQEHFDLVAINLWGDREVVQVGGRQFTEKTLAEALNVDFTPTLLFFAEDRDVVLRLDGYLPPEEFEVALNYVINRLEDQQTFTQYLAANREPPGVGKIRRFEQAMAPPYDLSGLAGDRPVAILFEEPDCPDCDLLHEKTFRDPAAGPLLADLDVVQLNRWSDTPLTLPDGTRTTASAWASELGIGYLPAIVLLDAGGEEILRVNAQFRTFHILGALDYAVSGAWRQEPNFQRYLSARAERIREQGIDVDIWKY
jgi:thioredoxin-related protein